MRVLTFASTHRGGDFHPVIALSLGLQARGHDVSVFCDPDGLAAVAPTGLRTVLEPEIWIHVASGLQAFRAQLKENPRGDARSLTIAWQTRLGAMLAPVFTAAIGNERPDLVLAPNFMSAAVREAASTSGVPWCLVVPTYDVRRDAATASMPIPAPAAPLVLYATDAVFDDALPRPGEHYVGPLFWESPSDVVPPYLSEPGPRWALVTVSLVPQGDIALVPVALRALSDLGLRSIATIGYNDRTAVGVAPDGARIERSASHAAVLARACIMVGHAGHGSVVKAMWYGVPMVLVPWGRDQPGVASRAERIGVARVVQPDALAFLPDAIDAVLQDDGYARQAVEHSRRLRATDPVRLACEIIERTFPTNGSSLSASSRSSAS